MTCEFYMFSYTIKKLLSHRKRGHVNLLRDRPIHEHQLRRRSSKTLLATKIPSSLGDQKIRRPTPQRLPLPLAPETAMAFAAILRAGLLAVPTPSSAQIFSSPSYACLPSFRAPTRAARCRDRGRPSCAAKSITASLELTEDNVRLALEEAKSEARELN
jgi:hypothetical protein